MKTTGKYFALTAAAAALLSVPAAGALAATATASDFKKADIDHSGTISESEFKNLNISGASFTTLDANGDDVLTLSELETHASAGVGASVDTPVAKAGVHGKVSGSTNP